MCQKLENRMVSASPSIFDRAKFAAFEAKMKAQGLSTAAIAAFKSNYDQLVAGATGLVPEAEIVPAADLPFLAGMPEAAPHSVKVSELCHLHGLQPDPYVIDARRIN